MDTTTQRLALFNALAPSRLEAPATPGMPPVVVLGTDARVDLVPGSIAGTRVVIITDGTGRVLTTLRLTPDAAASLVSGVMPIAATAPRVADALVTTLLEQELGL